VERLEAMGRWLHKNGEAIHGTTASPFRRLPWGRCTQRPGKLYLHVFAWPKDGRLVVPGLRNRVAGAALLAGGEALDVARHGDGVVVQLPATAPDADATVVVLSIEGAADVAPYRAREERGAIVLAAVDATVDGKSAHFEIRRGKGNIGAWLDAGDRVEWQLEVARPGTFRVEVRQACPTYTAGTPFRVTVADQTRAGTVQPTASWDDYVTLDLGEVKLEAGAHTLAVQATAKPKHAVMNLRTVRLVRKE
jgi:alpha-L-fucosidase